MDKMVNIWIFLSALILSANLFAATSVYEVSKGKNKLFLAGTVHLLKSEDFPPPAEFDATYKQSQIIYFETDIHKAKNPQFAQRFSQAMMLPNNTTLKDVLDADVWAELQAFSNINQYPLSQTMMYNPAMLSILITLSEAKKLGIGEGIDAFYDHAARADGKKIGELETSDDVIKYMKSFAQEDPNKIIKNTLNEAEHISDDLNEMTAVWRAGDLNALDKNMGEKMRVEIPAAYQSLVINRNQKWIPQIKQMLNTSEVEMVLVGSLHLSGKDGLLATLKKSGYSVKPYTIKSSN